MDPFTIGSIALPILTGVLGQNASAGARSNAENDMKNALGAYTNLTLPDIEKMRLALEEQQSVGTLTPATETAQTLGDTALGNIALDPKYNEYTMSALSKMAQVANEGLPDADRAQLDNILRQANQQNVSNQKAILENRAARGMGGSGDELAAQLAGAQSSANTASDQAIQLAGIAAQRKLDAADKSGSLGNILQQAEYNRQKDLYGQQDAISQFNANQKQGTQTRNVDRSNQAQQLNLQNAQNISNTNVATRNQQQQFNKGLEQTNFDNALKKASGVAGGYQNMAAYNTNQANATANMYGQLGGGLASGLLAAKGMGGAAAPAAGAAGLVGDQSIADGGIGIRAGKGFMT